MRKLLQRLARDERGISMLEYGIIGGVVSLTAVLSLSIIGTGLSGIVMRVAVAIGR